MRFITWGIVAFSLLVLVILFLLLVVFKPRSSGGELGALPQAVKSYYMVENLDQRQEVHGVVRIEFFDGGGAPITLTSVAILCDDQSWGYSYSPNAQVMNITYGDGLTSTSLKRGKTYSLSDPIGRGRVRFNIPDSAHGVIHVRLETNSPKVKLQACEDKGQKVGGLTFDLDEFVRQEYKATQFYLVTPDKKYHSTVKELIDSGGYVNWKRPTDKSSTLYAVDGRRVLFEMPIDPTQTIVRVSSELLASRDYFDANVKCLLPNKSLSDRMSLGFYSREQDAIPLFWSPTITVVADMVEMQVLEGTYLVKEKNFSDMSLKKIGVITIIKGEMSIFEPSVKGAKVIIYRSRLGN